MLSGMSGRTLRARAWRGVLEEDATARTIAQHADILRALVARDPVLAEAAALVHVATTEAWFRGVLGEDDGSAVKQTDARNGHATSGR